MMFRKTRSGSTWLPPICMLGALALLAACGTPQERCITLGAKEQRQIQRDITYHEQNISRGYAIHRQTIPTSYWVRCRGRDGRSLPCMRTGYTELETPVAIDIAEERRRVAALQQTLPAAKERAEAATAQCRVAYPDAPPAP